MNDLEVEILDTISNIHKNKWNNLVEQSKLGSFFHRYEWLKAIEDGIGLEPRHILVLKDEFPIGIFPNFIQDISKTPFKKLFSVEPGHGGPIIINREKQVLDLMLEKIPKICKGNIVCHYVRTRDIDCIRYERHFEKMGYSPILRHCRFVIDLNKTYKGIKASMSRRRRQEIDIVHKKDFEIKDEEINYENLKNFHRGYKKVMHRVGSSAYPFEFFRSLKDNVSDRIKIFTAIVEGKQVGKHFYLLNKEQSSLFALFLDIDPSNFKYYPSILLHDYAIRWGIENNYKNYDFDYAIADFNDGLFKFKCEFGAQAIPMISWEKGYSIIGWNLFKVVRDIYKKFK